MTEKTPEKFDFTKAENIANNIYNLTVILEQYCKNQPVKMAEFDCISTTVGYLKENSDKLSCMFLNHQNKD